MEAFPLAWPTGHGRTPNEDRQDGPYRVGMGQTIEELEHELRLLGGRDLVISTNVPLKRDGKPYANAKEPTDPGVAIYWTRDGRPYVIPCDSYTSVRDNLRAAGLAVYHLRRLEQSAGKVIADRAFAGFAALPATAGPDGSRPWRDVFGMWRDLADKASVRRRFQELAATAHPDKGGSTAAMAELNRAYKEALAELSEGLAHAG